MLYHKKCRFFSEYSLEHSLEQDIAYRTPEEKNPTLFAVCGYSFWLKHKVYVANLLKLWRRKTYYNDTKF